MAKIPSSEPDITLVRVLSLIPKNDDGTYKHGAKKEFAKSIGYKGGEIVHQWEIGLSTSYLNKIYEISSVHNVSVPWLLGQTDDKSIKNTLDISSDAEGQIDDELRSILRGLDSGDIENVKSYARYLKASHEK